MRVTNLLIKNNVLRNIQRNLKNMDHYQKMLSSGKSVNKPSDDPVRVARIMGYNTVLAQNQQYQRNIEASRAWVETTETALSSVNDILQRARELALAGLNGTMPESARQAIAMEVDQLNGVLVQIANSSIEGRYLFAGFQTTTVPFERNKDLLLTGPSSVAYHGDDGKISWEIAPNVTITGNLDGQAMFMDSGIFTAMDRLVSGLNSGDTAQMNAALGGISGAINTVLDKRASFGAIVNGLELTREKYNSEKLNFTGLRSTLEDIDFAETTMNFKTLENVYRASLFSGAGVLQPSLLDFLR